MQRQPFLTGAKDVVREFRKFIWRSRYSLLLLGLLTCLIHGDKLFSTNNGIDTEQLIYYGDSFYEGWLGIGRQGLVFFKWMLGLENYNPYFAPLLLLLFSVAALAAFTFLFEYIRQQQGDRVDSLYFRWLSFVFGLIVIAHPILTEQYYFTLQGVEVALSFALTAVSLLAAHKWAERGSLLWLLFSTALIIPVFSVYQAMVPLYIFGGAAMACLHGMGGRKERKTAKELSYALHLAAAFVCGFAANELLTALFFTRSGYISGQIQWQTAGMKESILRILSHVRDVAAGGGTFYFRSFFWLALALLAAVLVCGGRKMGGMGIWQLMLLGAVYASPFYLTLVMGERPVIRGQLVLPFTMGFMAYLTGVLAGSFLAERKGRHAAGEGTERKNKRKKMFVRSLGVYLGLVCAVSVWQETANTSRLYYTERVRYEEDVRLAGCISRDVAEFTREYGFDGTVVFVGRREAAGNHSTMTGDVMGHSLFAWDTEAEPVCFYSSCRILGLMHCMGICYQKPNAEQTRQAVEYARDMPCYPAEGSIAWCRGTLVVKLSDT